jgi:tetratricopeptide (TPR) repeat protein
LRVIRGVVRAFQAAMKKAKIPLRPLPGPAVAPAPPGLRQLQQTESELIAALFVEGFKLHQMGRLADAETIYRQILAVRPDHFDCLHLSGVIFHQRGDHAAAVRLIDRALERNPNDAAALNNRGAALSAQNRLAEALESFSRSVTIQPDFADAHCNRGNVLRQLGRFEEALANSDRAVKLRPDYAEAHSSRGLVLCHLLRFDEALASSDRALALRPNFADAHCNRGLALKELKRFDEALESYDRAIALRGDFAEAHSNRGNVLRELKRLDEALASCDRAIALRADFAEAHCARGNVLLSLKHFAEALRSYDRAIALRPGLAEAHCNRGIALLDIDRPEEALASYDRAVELQPDFAVALYNRAIALEAMDRFEEALQSYERSARIKPDHAEVHVNEALCRLLLGDFERGWEKYEWRWATAHLRDHKRTFPQPQWLGADEIAGKTVLLHAEQGLGDTVQFARYVPGIAARGARVVLEVQAPLRSLLTSLPGAAQVIAAGDPLPDFDLHSPLLSLPFVLRTRLDSIPAATPYLAAPTDKVNSWRDRLGQHTKPRIGLVWAGNPRKELPNLNLIDRQRSVAFETLVPLLAVTACSFYSLQKGDDAVKQLRNSAWRDHVIDFTDELHDFSDTAALIENLDLVVAVDTSVLHLAGALAKPVWLLNRYNTCWRWLRDRDDSPWYPGLRQFRQDASRDWDQVVRRVADALRDYAGSFK